MLPLATQRGIPRPLAYEEPSRGRRGLSGLQSTQPNSFRYVLLTNIPRPYPALAIGVFDQLF